MGKQQTASRWHHPETGERWSRVNINGNAWPDRYTPTFWDGYVGVSCSFALRVDRSDGLDTLMTLEAEPRNLLRLVKRNRLWALDWQDFDFESLSWSFDEESPYLEKSLVALHRAERAYHRGEPPKHLTSYSTEPAWPVSERDAEEVSAD